MSVIRACGVTLVVLFLLAPTLVVLLFSVYPSAYITFPPHGLTLRWYAEAMHQRALFLQPLMVSVWLGLSASAVSTVIGTLAALALARGKQQGRAAIEALLLAPILVPTLIVGFGLMLFLSAIDQLGSWWALVLGHVVITSAYVTQSVLAALSGVKGSLEEAAQSLGSSPIRAFRRITFPLILPGIVAGAVFAFILSFDELSVTLLLSNAHTTTLPVQIFAYIEQNSDPSVAAISTLLSIVSFGLLVALQMLGGLNRRVY